MSATTLETTPDHAKANPVNLLEEPGTPAVLEAEIIDTASEEIPPPLTVSALVVSGGAETLFFRCPRALPETARRGRIRL